MTNIGILCALHNLFYICNVPHICESMEVSIPFLKREVLKESCCLEPMRTIMTAGYGLLKLFPISISNTGIMEVYLPQEKATKSRDLFFMLVFF